jgi:hypothetical protein
VRVVDAWKRWIPAEFTPSPNTSQIHFPTLSALDSPRPPPGASWLFAQPPSLVHNRHTTTGDTFSTLLGARSGPVRPSVRHNLHEFIGNPRNLPIPKTLPAEATPQPCDIAALKPRLRCPQLRSLKSPQGTFVLGAGSLGRGALGMKLYPLPSPWYRSEFARHARNATPFCSIPEENKSTSGLGLLSVSPERHH